MAKKIDLRGQLEAHRDEIAALLAMKEAQGDFDAHAPAIRAILRSVLQLQNYLMDRKV